MENWLFLIGENFNSLEFKEKQTLKKQEKVKESEKV
jgi:hypothetical protein